MEEAKQAQLTDLEQRRRKIAAMGGPERVAGQKKKNKPKPDNWIDISDPNCKTGWMCVKKGECK